MKKIVEKNEQDETGLVKLQKKITNILSKKAFNDAFKIINQITMGKFSEAILKDYADTVLTHKSNDELVEIANDVRGKYSEVRKAEQQEAKDKELDSREDDNKNTELDKDTLKFDCLFSGDSGRNIVDVITKLNNDIKQNTEFVKSQDKIAQSEINKMDIKLDNKEKETLKPVVAGLVASGKSGEELEKEVEKVKKEIDESYSEQMRLVIVENMVGDNKTILTEEMKAKIYVESAVLCEGFWDSALSIFGKNKDAISNVGKTLVTKNTIDDYDGGVTDYLKKETNFTFSSEKTNWVPASWGKMAAAWAPILLSAAITLAYKYRKQIRNVLESQYKKFKNSKGGISTMGFKTVGNKTFYELQFSVKDFKWRCLNKKNILKYPSKDLLVGTLESDFGKKFRKWCNDTWEPIFGNGTEDSPPFSVLLNCKTGNGDELVDKNTLKMVVDFGNNWKKIQDDCLSDSFKFDIRPR